MEAVGEPFKGGYNRPWDLIFFSLESIFKNSVSVKGLNLLIFRFGMEILSAIANNLSNSLNN